MIMLMLIRYITKSYTRRRIIIVMPLQYIKLSAASKLVAQ